MVWGVKFNYCGNPQTMLKRIYGSDDNINNKNNGINK